MKIAILTYPLNNNFGNILQAWALKHYIESLGHSTYVINRQEKHSLTGSMVNDLKIFALKKLNLPYYKSQTEEEKLVYGKQTNAFIKKEIKDVSSPVYSSKELKGILSDNYDAVVVGSDQVWRASFLPKVYKDFFLSCIADNKEIKKIAYAASFGTDKWEYTPEQETFASEYVKHFSAISVREKSSIAVCQEHFNVSPEHMIDPTFLIEKESYKQLIEENKDAIEPMNGDVFCYILDLSEDKKRRINSVCNSLGLKPVYISEFYKTEDDKRVYPSIYQWLYNIENSKYVITDSFHGCALSIIFNKPFLALSNQKRGRARFVSLFNMFDINNCIIDPELLNRSIFESNEFDWEHINSRIKEYRNKSKIFLSQAL